MRDTLPRRLGVALFSLLLCLAPAARSVADPELSARFLVIVLDAVPYQAMVAITRPDNGDSPLLGRLAGPAPLISTFPSSTSIALPAILKRFGLEESPGYEAKFFDHDAGRVRGGGLISYRQIDFDWHHFFDWQLHGFFGKSRAYAMPRRFSRKEIHKSLRLFNSTDKRDFFIYINSTDALGHIRGPESLRETFVNLEARLTELRSHSSEPIYTILLSDHGQGGGAVLENIRFQVTRAIRSGGWRNATKLLRLDDVVLTPFGLVSSFEIYTQPGLEAAVAATVAREPGVDLCAYREDSDSWAVVDEEGRATFRRREADLETEWSYRIETADPLEYAAVTARLRERSRVGEWFGQRAWFDQTWNETYPDALYRIAAGFERVRNPASILCSVASGSLYGSKSASFGARFSVGRLKWTHGALLRDATLGFVMTDFPGWDPSPVRFDNALDFLADHLRPDQEP